MFDQINLQVRPSLVLSAIIALPCIAALILIVTRDVPIIVTLILSLFISGIAVYYIALCGLLRLKNSILRIGINKNELMLFDLNGKKIQVNLLPGSFITPWLCILVFSNRTDKETFQVLLCRKNIESPDEFRRFRVWSQYGNPPLQTTEHFK